MKTKITIAALSLFLTATVFSQGKASVYANNSDISDNLDLRAVASIFGDSKDLADFEYRLNDPTIQINNLDLNNDNQVDYLRVIEMVENNTHLVVLQSVLQEDLYQDVATIVVSKKKNKQINIQIIGDPYMYGSNYIYEPIYVVRPPMYSNFWATNYRPYRSYYGWNRYPTFFTFWKPYGYNYYHQNVYAYINHNNSYNYSNNIYNSYANDYYRKYRSNGYEQKYPHRDFTHRTSLVNKYEYDRQQGRSPQVTTGARSSLTTNVAKSRSASTTTSNSNGMRPTTTSTTVRPANNLRPTATTSTVRPATNSNSVIRPSNTNAAIRLAPTKSTVVRPSATTRTNTTNAQRSSNNSARSSATSSPSTQRSSNNSARSSQKRSGTNTTNASRAVR